MSYPKMHVSLYVSNLAATVQFYNSFFGVQANKIKKGYAKYELAEPALIISFIENPDRVKANFGHLGFQVETKEIMMQRLEKVKAAGMPIKEEMGTACCYAIQDKFWAADPDGYQWEVYYFHADAEFNDPNYFQEGSEACCLPAEAQTVKPEKEKVQLADLEANSCAPGSGCC